MKIFRFSMRFAFIFITAISLLLGLAAYLHEDRLSSWDLIWIPLACSWAAFVYWLFVSAGWSARAFVIGFFVGVFVEVAAMDLWISNDWINYQAPSYSPSNYYPLTFPSETILIKIGLTEPNIGSFRPWALGMLLSGASVGALFYIVWHYLIRQLDITKLIRRQINQ